MKTDRFRSRSTIKALKFPPRETPHATIETNRTCNLHCQSCYNLDREHIKSLALVRKEIDIIARKRNLQVVSLLGGEPTLHPELPEIVSYVKKKGLICQLLTNGIVFLQDKNDALLDKLIQAGLDKILLHIDSGQKHYHQDLDRVREQLFVKLDKKRIFFSLSVTIYNDSTAAIPGLVKKYAKYRYFEGILAVLARDPLPPQVQKAEMEDEYRAISSDLLIEPVAYIPSSVDDYFISWLIYIFFIHAESGRTFGISPFVNRLFRKVYRLIKGRHLFVLQMKPWHAFLLFLVSGLLESAIHPPKCRAFIQILLRNIGSPAIRHHYIAIQNPPEYDDEKNELYLCYSCPDATIRNGKLTPVCIADFVSPFARKGGSLFQKSYYQAAYGSFENQLN